MEIINNTKEVIINEKTTLGELQELLNLGEKPHDTPTPKFLRENAGTPIARMPDPLGYGDGCLVYANGYAVYDNGSGRTVVWLPDCTSYIYNFVQPKDSEVGIAPAKTRLPEGLLETLKWQIPVTLIGDHRVDDNLMNRTGSRTGTRDFDSQDNGDKDGDTESAAEEAYRKKYSWRDGHFGENPEDAYIRNETIQEMLACLTEKQREVFVLYYRDCYTQEEIARKFGVTQVAIKHLLDKAIARVKKIKNIL